MITLRDRLLGVSAEYQAFLDAHPVGREPFKGETLIADGWKYKDLPQLTPDQFITFLDVCGVANIRWLTFARGPLGTRGQLFLSPDGQAALEKYLTAPS